MLSSMLQGCLDDCYGTEGTHSHLRTSECGRVGSHIRIEDIKVPPGFLRKPMASENPKAMTDYIRGSSYAKHCGSPSQSLPNPTSPTKHNEFSSVCSWSPHHTIKHDYCRAQRKRRRTQIFRLGNQTESHRNHVSG